MSKKKDIKISPLGALSIVKLSNELNLRSKEPFNQLSLALSTVTPIPQLLETPINQNAYLSSTSNDISGFEDDENNDDNQQKEVDMAQSREFFNSFVKIMKNKEQLTNQTRKSSNSRTHSNKTSKQLSNRIPVCQSGKSSRSPSNHVYAVHSTRPSKITSRKNTVNKSNDDINHSFCDPAPGTTEGDDYSCDKKYYNSNIRTSNMVNQEGQELKLLIEKEKLQKINITKLAHHPKDNPRDYYNVNNKFDKNKEEDIDISKVSEDLIERNLTRNVNPNYHQKREKKMNAAKIIKYKKENRIPQVPFKINFEEIEKRNTAILFKRYYPHLCTDKEGDGNN